MKVPLIVGFLALLGLLGIDLALRNRPSARFERDQQRIRDLQAVRVGLEARHLVELHGGMISADSPGEGLGATFRVEIPIVAVKELTAQFAHRADDAGAAAAPTGEADRKAAIDAGIDGHLAKPIDAGMLLSKGAELLSRP